MFRKAVKPALAVTLISIIFTLIFHLLGFFGDTWTSLVSMATLIGLIVFFGNKERRENFNDKWTFGNAFGFSYWVILLSSLFSSVFNVFYFKFLNPGYIDQEYKETIENMGNASDEQIEQSIAFMDYIFNPIGFSIVAFITSLFFGLILALILGAVLKR